MTIGKAAAIFSDIESGKFADEEKAEAIYIILEMPTHNGISKNGMLKVIEWLLYRCFEFEKRENNDRA